MTHKADLIEAFVQDVGFDVECMPEDVQIEENAARLWRRRRGPRV